MSQIKGSHISTHGYYIKRESITENHIKQIKYLVYEIEKIRHLKMNSQDSKAIYKFVKNK
jgi:hypothetical protein